MDIIQTDCQSLVRHPQSDERFEVWEWFPGSHRALHSRVDFTKGETLVHFVAAARLAEPRGLSIQASRSEHILLEPSFLQLTNHGCEPNVFFDVTIGELKALEHIFAGEEIVYFYPSTEWAMAQPFQCQCDSAQCLGKIQGAKFVSKSVLHRYLLAPHIEALLVG